MKVILALHVDNVFRAFLIIYEYIRIIVFNPSPMSVIRKNIAVLTIWLCCILCGIVSFAQISLQNTHWRGFNNLWLNSDSLVLLDAKTNAILHVFTYHQSKDTLFIEQAKEICPSPNIGYQILYSHSGQLVQFSKLFGGCGTEKILMDSPAIYEFVSSAEYADRDWLYRDPISDSIAGISLTKAYELLKGRKPKQVIVAVIDNGFDIHHEDLKNNIWINKKEIPGNGIDDDQNGYTDDVNGWNFRTSKTGALAENEWAASTQVYVNWKNKYDNADVSQLTAGEKRDMSIFTKAKQEYLQKTKESNDSNDIKFAYNLNYHSSDIIGDNASGKQYGSPFFPLTPSLTHGTHVAGIISGTRDNHIGIDGIADNVLIMPIVATTAAGDERDKDIANAIRYAVDNGAKIINMSFSKKYSPDKNLIDDAIRYAERNNVLIIHAAGNDGENDDNVAHYPIAFYNDGSKANNFITVGWSRPKFNERFAHPFSDYGKNSVDLFAPGSDIFSTVPGDGYDYKSGSSMSAPVVSGVAALLFSYFPTLNMQQVKEIILNSVYKPGIIVNIPGTKIKTQFSSLSSTGGIVNAYNAVKAALNSVEKKNL